MHGPAQLERYRSEALELAQGHLEPRGSASLDLMATADLALPWMYATTDSSPSYFETATMWQTKNMWALGTVVGRASGAAPSGLDGQSGIPSAVSGHTNLFHLHPNEDHPAA